MTGAEALTIALAGMAAGAVNAVAGGGTLLSFPALLYLGRDPIRANATSALSLLPGSAGGAAGYREQLKEAGGTIRMMLLPSLLGGIVGAWLLLRTESERFNAMVPYLILSATMLLALQEPLKNRLPKKQTPAVALLLQFGVGVYGGYFGAGIGILMLAVLGLMGETDIHRMNGIKNLMALAMNGIAAVLFVSAGAVDYGDAALMALGALAGGYAGARLSQRISRTAVRRLVILIGLILTLALWIR